MTLQTTPQGMVTPVTWAFAPEWLTVRQACTLSGWDVATMAQIIAEAGVDLNDEGLIDKNSLWEFQDALALVLHWND